MQSCNISVTEKKGLLEKKVIMHLELDNDEEAQIHTGHRSHDPQL